MFSVFISISLYSVLEVPGSGAPSCLHTARSNGARAQRKSEVGDTDPGCLALRVRRDKTLFRPTSDNADAPLVSAGGPSPGSGPHGSPAQS